MLLWPFEWCRHPALRCQPDPSLPTALQLSMLWRQWAVWGPESDCSREPLSQGKAVQERGPVPRPAHAPRSQSPGRIRPPETGQQRWWRDTGCWRGSCQHLKSHCHQPALLSTLLSVLPVLLAGLHSKSSTNEGYHSFYNQEKNNLHYKKYLGVGILGILVPTRIRESLDFPREIARETRVQMKNALLTHIHVCAFVQPNGGEFCFFPLRLGYSGHQGLNSEPDETCF